MNHKEYMDAFKRETEVLSEAALTRAVDRAHDIRKFEIELYWKRATYFWAFLALTLGAYFTLLVAEVNDKTKGEALLIVSCLGVVFSVTWYFVNRASKFWQENWENHVNILEDAVIGQLYKTVLSDTHLSFWQLTGPYPFSVSRLNQILSLFILGLFLLLLSLTLFRYYCCSTPPNVLGIVVITLTAFTIACLGWYGRTGWWEARTGQRENLVEGQRLTTKLPD
ncbi:MAG TPA: hypothetical protein VIQ24_19135 [Pyrinomonadaceae bacterium]